MQGGHAGDDMQEMICRRGHAGDDMQEMICTIDSRCETVLWPWFPPKGNKALMLGKMLASDMKHLAPSLSP